MKKEISEKISEANSVLNRFLNDVLDDEEERIELLTDFSEQFCNLEIQESLWSYAIEKFREVEKEDQKELFIIGFFELLAEEPVSEIWLRNLVNLLSESKMLFMVIRVYKFFPEKLWEHLSQAAAQGAK